jgi:hypothetical protein
MNPSDYQSSSYTQSGSVHSGFSSETIGSSESVMLSGIVRQEISSKKENLDFLHRQRPWIPSSFSIRPLPEVIAQKFHDLQEINAKWSSMEDYLNHRIFGQDFVVDAASGQFISKANPFLPNNQHTLLRKLVRNEYPYQQLQCLHSVLWYNVHDNPYPDHQQRETYQSFSELVSSDIENELKRILPPYLHESFQFVWYENPKMSVPDYYHVHVFWVPQEE